MPWLDPAESHRDYSVMIERNAASWLEDIHVSWSIHRFMVDENGKYALVGSGGI